MTLATITPAPPLAAADAAASQAARARMLAGEGRGIFLADWLDALFVHYAVDPAALASATPLELDTRDGRAVVSLVVHRQANPRTRVGSRIAHWLRHPEDPAGHVVVTVRTYVRRPEPGVVFLARYIPQGLRAVPAPRAFGFPDQCAEVTQQGGPASGVMVGAVQTPIGGLRFTAEPDHGSPVDHWPLDRYTAFTRRGALRRFRLWHQPWRARPARATVEDDGLLASCGSWFTHAQFIGAAWSPGVRDVWIGRPHCLSGNACATVPGVMRG